MLSNYVFFLQATKKVRTLMDNDFHRELRLSSISHAKLIAQVESDSHFLCSQNIMDYSLLLGVHQSSQMALAAAAARLFDDGVGGGTAGVDAASQANPKWDKDEIKVDARHALPIRSRFRDGIDANVIEGPSAYYVGIIDILQEYDAKKQMERCSKVYCCCMDGEGISCMPPIPYANRFIKTVHKIVKTEDQQALRAQEEMYRSVLSMYAAQGDSDDDD